MPRCIYHNTKFVKKYRWQQGKFRFCIENDECYKALTEVRKEQEEIKKQKDWNKEKKQINESLKTKSEHEKELQPIINQIAREIDKDNLCLMCGKPPKKKNGCHYHSVGSNASLRFNLFNIWLGCESCNKWKGGNINGYDVELIKYYGKEKWEYIKFDLVRLHPTIHLSIPELKALKIVCRNILKEVKKLPPLTYEQRWKLREKLNKKIGIYN